MRQLAAQFGLDSSTPDPQYADFNFYYMGYFIRSCRKMCYKAHFRPSWLACPESYAWVPIDQCLAALDAVPGRKYARFSASDVPDPNAIPSHLSMVELEQRVFCQLLKRKGTPSAFPSQVFPLAQFKRLLRPQAVETLHECIRLLGSRVLLGNIRFAFRSLA